MCADCKATTLIAAEPNEASPTVPQYRVSVDFFLDGLPGEVYTKVQSVVTGLPEGAKLRRFNVESW